MPVIPYKKELLLHVRLRVRWPFKCMVGLLCNNPGQPQNPGALTISFQYAL